jgi:hypothetical protein
MNPDKASPDNQSNLQPAAGPDRSRTADCERVLALIPAYSIGATDADEEELIKATLADCPQAVAELAAYMKLADALHYSASPVEPPATLKASLSAALAQQQAAKPIGERFGQPLGGMSRQLAPVVGLLLLLLLIIIAFLLIQVEQLRTRQAQVAAQIHDQNTALILLGLTSANRIELPVVRTGTQPLPFAAIVWDPQGEYALLYVKNFPALQPGQAYQLWLERSGQATSGGVFTVDEDGLGTLLFRAPMSLSNYDSIEITVEPVNGSAKPTSAPLVQRKFLRHSQF